MAEVDTVLLFNLFDGDFGSGETAVINEICTAPQQPKCHICASKVSPGTLVRRHVETTLDPEDDFTFGEYERSRHEYFVCEVCCDAIRSHDTDRIDRRYAIGEGRRAKRQGGENG